MNQKLPGLLKNGATLQQGNKNSDLKFSQEKWREKLLNHLKFHLSFIIFHLVKILNSVDRRLTREIYNPNRKFYDELTPSRDIGDEKVYSEALSWALRNEEIKNIAITGPYGSGKSSILKSFEYHNKQYRYLNISLATFNEQAEPNDEQRKLIETSILQQIFYHVKYRQIPDSRFKRINRLTPLRHAIITFGLFIWITIAFYIFKPDFFTKISWYATFEKANHDTLLNLTYSIFFLGAAIVIYFCYRLLRNKRVSKLKVTSGGGEFELGQEEATSILNKHLDEILYFFEATSFNVVIIEDLDRFRDPEIFTKLREINILINNSKQIGRKVAFIYAVRDDMFVDKSRAKFFDFIIPVIPVINSSNSIDILLQKLSIANLDKAISEEFISDITLYVDDMRMLKNVINEYIIYKDKIGARLNQDKLFGMIIYKNLYPSDFAALHIGQGKVHEALVNKENFIKTLVNDLDIRIDEKEKLLAKVDKLTLKNIEELRSIYILVIVEKLLRQGSYATVSVGGTEYSIEQLKEDSAFDNLVRTKDIKYLYGNYTFTTFPDIQKIVDPHQTYKDREKEVKLKSEGQKNELKEQLERLKIEKLQLQDRSLADILQSFDHLAESLHDDKLLLYLLRYGYIDEMYYSYLSYFYEGSITKEDNDFILSVKNHEAKPFNYRLTKTEQLIKKLRPAEFSLSYILNYNLIDFLLKNQDTYNSHLQKVLLQIISKESRAISFLDSYLKDGATPGELITALAIKWESLWEFIYTSSTYTTEQKDKFLLLILRHVNMDFIERMNYTKSLTVYISKKSDFLQQVAELGVDSKVEALIRNLNVKFENLETADQPSSLVKFIYNNSAYEINENMIDWIIKVMSKENVVKDKELKTANYTTMQHSDCRMLIDYIENNIEIYVDNVFLTLPDNTKESETTVIALLNNEHLSDNQKDEIINKEEVFVKDINSVISGAWDIVVSSSKLDPTWSNILAYYENAERIESPLIKFLNNEKNYSELSKQKLQDTSSELQALSSELADAIVLCNEISDEAYTALLKGIDNYYTELNLKDLTATKIEALIDQKKLLLSQQNFTQLKKRFSGLHLALLKAQTEDFLKEQENYSLSEEDYIDLLDSNHFSAPQKEQLISSIDDELVGKSRDLASSIYEIVVHSNIRINSILLNKVFEGVSTTKKVKLLTARIKQFTKEEVIACLQKIGEPFLAVTTNARPLFEDNELNRNLLTALAEVAYISSFSKVENKLRAYPKNR